MNRILNKSVRLLVSRLPFLAPASRRLAWERRLRGEEEQRKLALSDCVVVSFGKSGRTWLRVMLSRFYQLRHGLGEHQLIGFDNLHRKNRGIPKLFFTHDTYLKYFTGHVHSKQDYYGHRVILLVRDPGDVAVSQFFQWRFRMRAHKKRLNEYPADGEDVELFDYVMNSNWGLHCICEFLNRWAEASPHIGQMMILRYEDLRADPEAMLGRVLDFIGTPGNGAEISQAVDFASVESMRAMERRKTFRMSGSRLLPRDRNNPDSFKVRRAKVGGYRDYFDDAQIEEIDAYIRHHLSPVFGYGQRDRAPAAAPN